MQRGTNVHKRTRACAFIRVRLFICLLMFGIAALITNDVEEFSEYTNKLSMIYTRLLQ